MNDGDYVPIKRVFGFFRCKNCQHFWTSAYTWNIIDEYNRYKNNPHMYMNGYSNVTIITLFKQDCKHCNQATGPYDTRKLLKPNYHNHHNEFYKSYYRARNIEKHVKNLCHRCKYMDQSCAEENVNISVAIYRSGKSDK